jgi:serine/threonine protein kinase
MAGPDGRYKLVDFGNSVPVDALEVYFDSFQVQSANYRAPEVVVGMPFGTHAFSLPLIGLYPFPFPNVFPAVSDTLFSPSPLFLSPFSFAVSDERIDEFSAGVTLLDIFTGSASNFGSPHVEGHVVSLVDALGPLPPALSSGRFWRRCYAFAETGVVGGGGGDGWLPRTWAPWCAACAGRDLAPPPKSVVTTISDSRDAAFVDFLLGLLCADPALRLRAGTSGFPKIVAMSFEFFVFFCFLGCCWGR